MAVYFDLAIIQKNLAKAKADVEFWERASAILNDPRISATTAAPQTLPSGPIRGELRERVNSVLPAFGAVGISITAIVRLLSAEGYEFKAKHHGVAVNDALRILEKTGGAIKSGKSGLAILWTKGKSREAPEGAS